jgi:putative transposase
MGILWIRSIPNRYDKVEFGGGELCRMIRSFIIVDPSVYGEMITPAPAPAGARASAYFVTTVAKNRECMFGDVIAGLMKPNDAGCIIQTIWCELPARFPFAELDAFIVMPNHIHEIIVIMDHEGAGCGSTVGAGCGSTEGAGCGLTEGAGCGSTEGAGCGSTEGAGCGSTEGAGLPRPFGTATLGQMVAYFKYQTTKRINQIRGTPGVPVWQRNYWEHIIRDNGDLSRTREYIQSNPATWEMDNEKTERRAPGNR